MDRSADNLGQIINDIQRELEELKTTQLRARETFYPVGSIYMSAAMSTVEEVQVAIGGTWEAWGTGRVPVGVDPEDTDFDTVEETGGEKTHTLTVNEMPAHTHPANSQWVGHADSGTWLGIGSGSGFQTGTYERSGYTTQSAGGGGSHNNLQPYITCYMFKRVA